MMMSNDARTMGDAGVRRRVARRETSSVYNNHEATNGEVRTTYDWQAEKYKYIYDDGTNTFFWRAHTLTVLLFFIAVLMYITFIEDQIDDSNYNSKRGLVACILAFILLGVTVTPDGPFRRPHPAVWRFVFCCSIVYELGLIFLLFQTPSDARVLLRHFDESLGRPLEERSYGGSCVIYDSERPDDPFHNVKDKIDCFVPTHLIGWWLKTLVLRDWWLCTVLSVAFEVLEYTLEHQLPNFSECWWDHWIMDALVCNGIGIYLGLKTLQYFSMKTYHWRGLWNISSYSGKLKRIIAQFGPYSWVDFEWKPTSTLGRWGFTLLLIFVFLVAELNTFYLKFVLWVPPEHYLNLVRLFYWLLVGAVALRETFQYMDDPDYDKFGRQSLVVCANVCTEFLIVAKFDSATITKPLPKHIAILWVAGLTVLACWTIWNFFLKNNKPNIPRYSKQHYGLIKLTQYVVCSRDDVSVRREKWQHQNSTGEKNSTAT